MNRHKIQYWLIDLIDCVFQILSENKIGNEGVVALCHILCKNDMINKLDLSGQSAALPTNQLAPCDFIGLRPPPPPTPPPPLIVHTPLIRILECRRIASCLLSVVSVEVVLSKQSVFHLSFASTNHQCLELFLPAWLSPSSPMSPSLSVCLSVCLCLCLCVCVCVYVSVSVSMSMSVSVSLSVHTDLPPMFIYISLSVCNCFKDRLPDRHSLFKCL